MRAALWLLFALATLGFFATFFFEAAFEGRSTKIQLVRREAGPESAWKTVGEPFDVVNLPRRAVVEPGRDGLAALVDAERVNREGPVLRTDDVRQFAWLARGGCAVAALLLFFGIRLSDRLGREGIDATEA